MAFRMSKLLPHITIPCRGKRLGAGLGSIELHGYRRSKSSCAALEDEGVSMEGKQEEVQILKELEKKVMWLSTYMIHHANNVRPNADGLKVGGHQASSTSLATIMTAVYFRTLQAHDRVAVKPHASPIYHAIEYLAGNQTQENLLKFRALSGCQSYPSRTKDRPVEVDFSTGSVGLGAATALFAAYMQEFLLCKGLKVANQEGANRPGRMVALVGDAELDEGNVYEALLESWKLGIQNAWWIVDYNRQSLDKVTEEQSFRQIERLFRGNGWNVVMLKYGKKLENLFSKKPGGAWFRRWIGQCDNFTYNSLCFRGGAAFRTQIEHDIGDKDGVRPILDRISDDELFATMTNLAGHDFETLMEAFDTFEHEEKPTCFIAYTIKGYGLPLQGHPDNHGLFMTHKQVDELRNSMGVAQGRELEAMEGVRMREAVQAYIKSAPFYSHSSRRFGKQCDQVGVPEWIACKKIEESVGKSLSTQTAFGHIMTELGRQKTELSDRIMTTAPDVASSTNLTGFLNRRGLFSRTSKEDPAKSRALMSLSKWAKSKEGQHIELGIAENNLFLLLAAAGLTGDLFGQRLFPIGTLYDPFISRGLDALNYACYSDARFMVVATPSGISLGPEGGAHQSIYTPLIGVGQPGLTYFEPTYADELQPIMAWALGVQECSDFTQPKKMTERFYLVDHMQRPNGGSTYLRLSTRSIPQRPRQMSRELRQEILSGAYWNYAPRGPKSPGQGVGPAGRRQVLLAFTGVLAPEVDQAKAELEEDGYSVAVLQVTSPSILYEDWRKLGQASRVGKLLQAVGNSPIVTVSDGHSSTLSWLGAVRGQRLVGLGVDRFGQSGNIPDLYREYEIDAQAIAQSCRELCQQSR